MRKELRDVTDVENDILRVLKDTTSRMTLEEIAETLGKPARHFPALYTELHKSLYALELAGYVVGYSRTINGKLQRIYRRI